MSTEITTAQGATGFSAQSLTPNVRDVLDRAGTDAIFSDADIALIAPIAREVASIIPADERTIRQTVGSLSVSLPSQDSGEIGGRLKLNTYQAALAGCDVRALRYAYERCLKELRWFPLVIELLEMVKSYRSPDHLAITQARFIVDQGKRQSAETEDISDGEIAAGNAAMRKFGIATRSRRAADGSVETYTATPEELAAEASE